LQQFGLSNTINIHIISLSFLVITIGIDYLIMITFHKRSGVASLLITSRNNIRSQINNLEFTWGAENKLLFRRPCAQRKHFKKFRIETGA